MLFFSTGEISLADKIAEDGNGRKAKAGQEVRVLDIPADAGTGFGLFDHTPAGTDGTAFATELCLAASEVYGTPARAFIEWLCAGTGPAVTAARRIQDQMLGEIVTGDADGQVRRAARRFALVAAAGELATHAGVLPWGKGEACRAAMACFNAWIEARGGSGAGEVRDGIEQIRLFLEKRGASRFQNWDADSTTVPNRAGFTRPGEAGQHCYYILPAVWKAEVCQGRDARVLAAALVERGFLEADPKGKAARSMTVPALGQSARLYCLNSRIFEGDGDG